MQESPSLKSVILLSAVGLLMLLINIDYTAVNLALLPISAEINSNLAVIQWLLSAYVLAWSIFVIPAGHMADKYGKMYPLVSGILSFILGSGFCGFGYNIEIIILGRILQGLGAALFIPPSFASVYLFAPQNKQGFVMGIVMSCGGLGLAIGPIIAGIILDHLSWRWIFYVNLPLCVLILCLFLKFFPTQDKPKNTVRKTDVSGLTFLMLGLGTVVIMINRYSFLEESRVSFWIFLFLGLFLIGFGILRDQLTKSYLFPAKLFLNRKFCSAILIRSLMAMNLSLILFLMGLFLQNIGGYSSRAANIVFVSMTLTMGFISLIGGRIIDLWGVRLPMIFGATVTLLAATAMSRFNIYTSLNDIIIVLILAGLGLQSSFSATNLFIMRSVSKDDLGMASAIYSMFAMLGSTLGVVLPTIILIKSSQYRLNEILINSNFEISTHQHQELVNLLASVTPLANQIADMDSINLMFVFNYMRSAFVYGFSINMCLCASLAIITLILALWGTKFHESILYFIKNLYYRRAK